jgi:hypothetical protein
MTRARRLRHRAPLAPGTDARHRRQPAATRRRGARHAVPHTPAQQQPPEPPKCPVLGPRPGPPARVAPPAQAGPIPRRAPGSAAW